jgi:hypothetical protein
MVNGSERVQSLRRMAAIASNSAPRPAAIQRKVFIEAKPYTFEDGTGRMHGSGENMQHTFTPGDKAKAKQWAADPWERDYASTAEFQDHIGGTPVKCGLFREMALWYRLPFKTGTPFVLGENHSTKVTPIMKESNRHGTILHESNGVIPIKSKTTATKPDGDGFHKTAMESTVAKTLFGVTFHQAKAMKPKAPPNYLTESADVWIGNYAAAKKGKGTDDMGRPYYEKDTGEKVIQGDATGGYSSVKTLGRVVEQFDLQAQAYIDVSDKPKPKKAVQEAKDLLATWWTDMQEISEKYKDQVTNAKRIETLENQLAPAREKLIEKLTALFKAEYKGEIEAKVTPIGNPSGSKINAMDERREAAKTVLKGAIVESMAMRDLAMLTAIVNTKSWGDHEMISMGDHHVTTLGPAIKERANLEVIPRAEFSSAWSKPAL